MVLQPQIEVPVLVVGGGPVGQLAALQLAKNGVRCMLVERNATTTTVPKMEYLNMRSMELLQRMGLAQKVRDIGVPDHYDLAVLFSTGLSEGGELFSRYPVPRDKMEEMNKTNDGSAMTQTYLHSTQINVEARLQKEIQGHELTDARWSTKFESLAEDDDHVVSQLTGSTGESITVRSQYVIGCDGAGSRVRRQLQEVSYVGDSVPAKAYMVYFRSNDLELLHKQGRFWHIFFTNSCALIAQDEKELWLLHSIFPADLDTRDLKPEQVVRRALGGSLQPADIKIDEIVTVAVWRPGIFIADKYASQKGRVLLAGDAAHQVIPTGGFGLNTGVGDVFDLGWKLASVLKGHSAPGLLASYDLERRPVSARNIAVTWGTWQRHVTWWKWLEGESELVSASTAEGRAPRQRCHEHLQKYDHENQDYGIESDYRYNGSPVIVADLEVSEPPSSRSHHTPSTWPGSRAPALLLKDGTTNIHDLFGRGLEFTLFDFSKDGQHADKFREGGRRREMPLKVIHLPDEEHVHRVYERDSVLIRPDGHVAWRCNVAGDQCADVASVLSTVTGKSSATSAVIEQAAQAVQTEGAPPVLSC